MAAGAAEEIAGVGGYLVRLAETYPAGGFGAVPGVQEFVSECSKGLNELLAITNEIRAQ
jgi:hypothetical protein